VDKNLDESSVSLLKAKGPEDPFCRSIKLTAIKIYNATSVSFITGVKHELE